MEKLANTELESVCDQNINLKKSFPTLTILILSIENLRKKIKYKLTQKESKLKYI